MIQVHSISQWLLFESVQNVGRYSFLKTIKQDNSSRLWPSNHQELEGFKILLSSWYVFILNIQKRTSTAFSAVRPFPSFKLRNWSWKGRTSPMLFWEGRANTEFVLRAEGCRGIRGCRISFIKNCSCSIQGLSCVAKYNKKIVLDTNLLVIAHIYSLTRWTRVQCIPRGWCHKCAACTKLV